MPVQLNYRRRDLQLIRCGTRHRRRDAGCDSRDNRRGKIPTETYGRLDHVGARARHRRVGTCGTDELSACASVESTSAD